MNVHERQHIGFSTDDANTELGIHRALRFGFPVQAHVIVTNDRKFPMSVPELAQRFGDDLKRLHGVLHVSLFTGIFPDDKEGWFGKGGELERFLFDLENPRFTNHSQEYLIQRNNQLRNFLRPRRQKVIDEIARQVFYYSDQFKSEPYGLSYHFGIHNALPIHEVYEEAARLLEMPYRYAPDRMGVPYKGRIAVFDRFNRSHGVKRKDVLRGLRGIRRVGIDTEIMLHLGDGYGESQFNAFQDEGVRNTVKGFLLERPSSMWRRVEYPQAK